MRAFFNTKQMNACFQFQILKGVGDDEKCIVDKTKPASDEGNYMDCTDETLVAQGKTDCCAQDGSVGCCKPGERWVPILRKVTDTTLSFQNLLAKLIYIRGSIDFSGGEGFQRIILFARPPPSTRGNLINYQDLYTSYRHYSCI